MSIPVYSLQSLHSVESTFYADDSYHIFNTFPTLNSTDVRYSYPAIDYDIVSSIFNDFCFFHAKIQESPSSPRVSSFIPLGVIRFMLHHDLSFSEYDTPRRKPGYVVEGMFWSNGIVYRIREDSKNFQTYELTVLLDKLTPSLMNLSSPEKYLD